MNDESVDGFPAAAVRARARAGTAALFPPLGSYGRELFGARSAPVDGGDALETARLVPPVFMPERLKKLIELGREPVFDDVCLDTGIGGFAAPAPVFVSAFGSTELGSADLGLAVSAQAGRLGIPMVIGENVVPVHGYAATSVLLRRIRAYLDAVPDSLGGVVIQQSTEDADAEVWNLLYSDPLTEPLLASGRLGFELKVGQGAKPGMGGMTVVDKATAARLNGRYPLRDVLGTEDLWLRSSSPGTFTDEILTRQIQLMRNNFPRARVWVKLPPGRDVAGACAIAWANGADAVTVDGAEGGTGWAPLALLDHVGLPLAECLRRIGAPAGCLLASGRMWEGSRAVKSLALGARAVGLGRAALIAVDEAPDRGLIRLLEALTLEMRLLISALGRYAADALSVEDIWFSGTEGVHADR